MSPSDPTTAVSLTLDDVVRAHGKFLAAIDAGRPVTEAARAAYGWDLRVSEPAMLLAQIDQIVIRGLTSFAPDNDAPLILDCGANVGISVLEFKRRIPRARVIAFEPDPSICEELRGNLRRNGANDVEVVEAAVWTSTGQAAFASTGGDGGRVSESGAGARVRTVDLRDFLGAGVDLLKIDIEGAEYGVVAHIEPQLDRVKNLIVECHIDQSRLTAFGELLSRLHQAGFALSFNTFGHWRDLTRWSTVAPFHFEQYVAAYGTRGSRSHTGSSSQPYVEFPVLLEHYRHREARRGPQEYRQQQTTTVHQTAAKAITIQPPFTHLEGLGWTVRLHDSLPPGDSPSSPQGSALVLFENGEPLGPPHSEHAAINTFGGGRYSHWHNYLYFSTPDGSDPNRNGRAYAVAIPA